MAPQGSINARSGSGFNGRAAFLGCLGLLVVCAAGVAVLHFGSGRPFRLTAVAVVAAVAITAIELRARGPIRAVAPPVLLVLSAGILMWFIGGLRLEGALAIAAGIGGLLPLGYVFFRQVAWKRRPSTFGVVAACAAGLGLALSVLATQAVSTRSGDMYYRHYGRHVQLTRAEDCTQSLRRTYGARATVQCTDAAWTVDGATVRGSVDGLSGPMLGGVLVNADTYAVGHTARALPKGTPDNPTNVVVLGKVPLWLGLAFPVVAVAVIVAGLVRRGRRRSGVPA